MENLNGSISRHRRNFDPSYFGWNYNSFPFPAYAILVQSKIVSCPLLIHRTLMRFVLCLLSTSASIFECKRNYMYPQRYTNWSLKLFFLLPMFYLLCAIKSTKSTQNGLFDSGNSDFYYPNNFWVLAFMTLFRQVIRILHMPPMNTIKYIHSLI